MKRKVAILASADMMPNSPAPRADAFEREEQMGKLVPACAARGIALELAPWRDFTGEGFDAALPLLCWDYWDAREPFLSTLEAASCRVFNSPDVLRWNTDKAYLRELDVPTLPTFWAARADAQTVGAAFAQLEADTLVVKPQVGAGAWRQARVRRGEPLPAPETLPPNAALIQPFQTAIETEGEVSLLLFQGRFSHALRKLAAPGDYRIQSIHGGREESLDPTPEMIALAERALAGRETLYARVDLLRDNDGRWAVIELELVEPYFYLAQSSGEGGSNAGAQAFADALANALGGWF